MNWKSTAVVSGATLLATWFGWTSTPGDLTPARQAPARDVRPAGGTDIQEQAERLKIRVRREVEFQDPSRNPFRFGARRAARRIDNGAAIAAPPVTGAAGEPAAPVPAPLTLSGIAEENADGQTRRTAIISTSSGPAFVRPGDRVDGYAVTRIEDTFAELTADDGTVRRLTLAP
jgi:hypothetical protein